MPEPDPQSSPAEETRPRSPAAMPLAWLPRADGTAAAARNPRNRPTPPTRRGVPRQALGSVALTAPRGRAMPAGRDDWIAGMTSRFGFARREQGREHHARAVVRRFQPHFPSSAPPHEYPQDVHDRDRFRPRRFPLQGSHQGAAPRRGTHSPGFRHALRRELRLPGLHPSGRPSRGPRRIRTRHRARWFG